MRITEVVVSVHEKRNHPYEYGHYDADVRLTADVSEEDNLDQVILQLREIARMHVKNECNTWIAMLHDLRQRSFDDSGPDDDD